MNNDQNQSVEKQKSSTSVNLLLFITLFLLLIVLIVLGVRNKDLVQRLVFPRQVQNYDEILLSTDLTNISLDDGRKWTISYEKSDESYFSGVILHTSPIRKSSFALLSHDILVTTGDFSNPKLVWTDVSNHHFSWRSLTSMSPQGTINLLHTVPIDEDIFHKLNQIKYGDNITIIGYEIYEVNGFDKNDVYIGTWKDEGCNTTLITDVIFN